MARYSFRLPDIGEGIAEAEIVAWHVKIGDRIEEDAQLADMMTDKATVEMESPVTGIVVELAGEVGDMVSIGSTLAVIETEGDGAVDAPPADTPVEEEIVAETPGAEDAKYIHGHYGQGTFTFYGGHDPEDYQHAVGDPPTDLALHKHSPGYRLILNNVLFPAAEKKEKKT